MKYLVSEVENWGKEIDALPAPDPGRRKVGKKAAVFLLAKKLQAAARRGFSTAELLEILASKGLTVHVDTVRAALKVGARGAVTSPVRNRKSTGALTRLRDGNGTEAETTTGRWNAGVSGGDGPEHRAEVGPELPLPFDRGAGGESAVAEAEKKTASGRPSAGKSDSERAEKGTEAGPDGGPTEGRAIVGEMPASRASRPDRAGSEIGSDRCVMSETGGVVREAAELQEVGDAPGGVGVDDRRARLSLIESLGKQVAVTTRLSHPTVSASRPGWNSVKSPTPFACERYEPLVEATNGVRSVPSATARSATAAARPLCSPTVRIICALGSEPHRLPWKPMTPMIRYRDLCRPAHVGGPGVLNATSSTGEDVRVLTPLAATAPRPARQTSEWKEMSK
jgi:hypothetical protein